MPLADLWHRAAFHGAIHGVTGAMRCASYEETMTMTIVFKKVKLYWMILLMVIGSLFHYLQGFIHPGDAGFLPSTVSFENISIGRTISTRNNVGLAYIFQFDLRHRVA